MGSAHVAMKARERKAAARAMQREGRYREAEARLLDAIGFFKLAGGDWWLDRLNAEIELAAS